MPNRKERRAAAAKGGDRGGKKDNGTMYNMMIPLDPGLTVGHPLSDENKAKRLAIVEEHVESMRDLIDAAHADGADLAGYAFLIADLNPMGRAKGAELPQDGLLSLLPVESIPETLSDIVSADLVEQASKAPPPNPGFIRTVVVALDGVVMTGVRLVPNTPAGDA